MDVRHLVTFHAVLREGSFRGAARALGLAQPTVTLHIQELEAEIGLPLFDRSGRQREKTAAGDLLAARAMPILDAFDSLERSMAELREGQSGLLRIGAIEPAASSRITPLLGRLRRRRPGLRVRMEVGGTTGVSRAVADAQVDVGLCSAPAPELGLRFEPLFEEEMALLLPEGHRLAGKRALLAGDLDGEDLLVTEQGCAYRGLVERALGERGVRPRWALESGSVASLREAVRQRLGLAVIPRLAASPAPDGTVARRISDLVIALPVGLVTRPGSAPGPPALVALIDEFRRAFRREAVTR